VIALAFVWIWLVPRFVDVDTDFGGYLDLGGMFFFIVIGVGMMAYHDMDFMLRIVVPGMRDPD
jgi:hypothetical protein